MDVEQNFKIEIKNKLEEKIRWFVDNYSKEISGWLVGDISEDKIVLEDMLIPEQEVGGASVDTDGKALVKLRKEYGNKCLKIIGHFHSHNTMGIGWSATDEEFMKQYSEQRDLCVFIVSSKGVEHQIRVEMKKPFRISLDELEYSIISENPKVEEECLEIIKDKLIESSAYTYPNYENYPVDDLTDKELNRMFAWNKKTFDVKLLKINKYQFDIIDKVFPNQSKVYRNRDNTYTIIYTNDNKGEMTDTLFGVKEYLKWALYQEEIDDEGRSNYEMNYSLKGVGEEWNREYGGGR